MRAHFAGAVGNMREGCDKLSQTAEQCWMSKLARKLKQQALRLVAAWTAGAGGTRSSMALAEQPRTRLVKTAGDDAGAEDMVAQVRAHLG